jgi:tetratricopeptide (TPR) repeat protein
MNTPDPAELRTLLDNQRPRTVLTLLEREDLPLPLHLYKAEALFELDRNKEAYDTLQPVYAHVSGDELAQAQYLQARILLNGRQIDDAILYAEAAARSAVTPEWRATAIAWSAAGHAQKHCWKLAESALGEASQLAPNHPLVLKAEGRVRLEMDQRLEARAIYERLARQDSVLARVNGEWGRAYVAFLLGAFAEARDLAESILGFSEEVIGPLYLLAQIALVANDADALANVIERIAQRSPDAATLPVWREEAAKLQARLSAAPEGKHRLSAFPTTIQRRNYCGPCTIELVLRYWKGGLDLTNDQIARVVKFPDSGSPTYRMREFFHLVGFDTVRCLAPIEKLKQLIDAGYPVIVQEDYSASSHVAVVIGYDETAGTIELQDPMTHAVTSTPYDTLNKLRRTYLDAAIVAFPDKQGHDKTLARMGLFDEAAVVWTDQAGLALDENRPQAAADLMARATQKLPGQPIAWILWLHALSYQWSEAHRAQSGQPTGRASRLARTTGPDPAALRQQFYDTLARAKERHPDAEFVYQFEGNGALTDGDIPRALAAYQRAAEIDPNDPRNLAALAGCYYAERQVDKAGEAAQNALYRDPTLPGANAWMARALAQTSRTTAFHYARAAAELASDWWLSHLALAEANLLVNDLSAARRAADIAVSLAPQQAETHAVRGIILAMQDDPPAAVAELETALTATPPLNTMMAYRAQQMLCRIFYSANLYEDAADQAQQLLALAPDDPWTLQFLAAVRSQLLLQASQEGEQTAEQKEAAVAELRHHYTPAIQANEGVTWIVRDYLNYLAALAGEEAGVEEAARLRQEYTANANLAYLHGQFLARAGQTEPAGQAMLAALSQSGGISNFDELYEAIYAILNGLGVAEGDQAVVAASTEGIPLPDRERTLGLVLTQFGEEWSGRARELLRTALAQDPDDAYAALRLGDVVEEEGEREDLYRRALMLAPRWSYARAHLAHFLLDNNRAADAVQFTEGHESESLSLLAAHGRALIYIGRFEEAITAFGNAIQQVDQPSPWLYYYKWLAEDYGGHHEAAFATAQQATQLFPDEADWYRRAADALRNLERFDEAQQWLAEGKAHGLDELLLLEGEYETAWANENYEAALQLAEQLAERKGEGETNDALGRWQDRRLRLLLELDRVDEARQLLDSKTLAADGWGTAAWTAMMAEAWEFCLELAGRALELDPEHFSGLFTRAEALKNLDRSEETIAAYDRLRDAHPEEHNAYEKLAMFRIIEGQQDEALALAERAIALGSFCPFAWATRGYVHFIAGRHADALADLEAGWNRADVERRRTANDFWWLMATLQGRTELAQERRQKAYEEAQSSLDRAMLAQLDSLLSPSHQEINE